MRGGIFFEEIDDDLRIVVPALLRFQVIRQAHERGHFPVTETKALNQVHWIPNIRANIQKVRIAFLA
jgi:hypothetical protein